MNGRAEGAKDYDARVGGHVLDLPPLPVKEFTSVSFTFDHASLPGRSQLAAGVGPADTLFQLPNGDGVDLPSDGVIGIYANGLFEHVDIVARSPNQLQVIRRKGARAWEAGASLIAWNLVTLEAYSINVEGRGPELIGAATFGGGDRLIRPAGLNVPACGAGFWWSQQDSPKIQPGDIRWVLRTRVPMRTDVTAWSDVAPETPLRAEHHSVAWDGTTVQNGNTNGGSSISLTSHTTSGTNRYALASVAEAGYSTLSSITYGGAAMTAIAASSATTGDLKAYLRGYIAPATTGSTCAVTFAGSTDSSAGIVSYNGVHQTTPVSASNTGSSTSAGPTVNVTSTSGGIVAGVSSSGWATSALGAGQTQRWTQNVFSYRLGWCSDEAGTGSSVTHSYTVTGSGQWGIAACNIQQAVTGYSLDCTAGSFAITGAAAALRSARSFAAAAGSVAITGASAKLAAARRFAADGGSLAVTGASATLRPGRILLATPGALLVSGAAARLAAARLFIATGGTYDITGAAAAFVRSRQLACAAGSFAITGASAALLADRHVAAGAGSVAITGASAALQRFYALIANAGAFTIAGADVNPIRALLLAATAGSLAISGATTALRTTRQLAAEPGAYAITGASSGLLRDLLFEADSGTLVITGGDADLQHSIAGVYEMVALPGDFAITGSPASLARAIELIASPGAIVIEGPDRGATLVLRRLSALKPAPNMSRLRGRARALELIRHARGASDWPA